MLPLRDNLPTRSPTVVNYLLIAANVLVFGLEASGIIAVSSARHSIAGALVPAELVAHPLANLPMLVSHLFLHGGIGHIAGNMLFLWIFGDNVEDALGSARYLLFYLACGITAALAQVALDPHATVPMVGASGAISGVLGAYILLYPRSPIMVVNPIPLMWLFWGLFIWLPAWVVLIEWFAGNLLSIMRPSEGQSVGGVAFAAHVGGFVAGLILSPLLRLRGGVEYEPWQRLLPEGGRRFAGRRERWSPMSAPRKTRIVILGAGVAGTYLAVELERLSKKRDVDVTLVSRDNFYLMTPLLFEAASGSVEVRHVVNPIRPMLATTRFVRAEVTHVDFGRRVVSVQSGGEEVELQYDQLVVALGGAPRYDLVPGARHALAFKTIEDAIALRTHVLDMFERATLERDAAARERLLRLVIVGGGLVGVELAGEMWHFLESLRKTYRTIRRHEVSIHIVQSAPELVPELDPPLRAYVEKTYADRGIRVHTATAVQRIDPQEVHLGNGERMFAGTIVYAAGLAVSPVVASFPIERDGRARIVTDATMRSVSHHEVWAIGDNAAVPIPDRPGETYPALSQHAHREAKALARNLMRVAAGDSPEPFVARSLGTAALLGGRRAVINVSGFHIRGFVAWWLWRTLFLLRVPSWERRLRLIADWTVALLFPADSSQVRLPAPAAAPPVRQAP